MNILNKCTKLMLLMTLPISVYADDISELTLKAENGDAKASLKLGHIYKDGNVDISKDHKKAIYWYKQAEKNGSKNAQFYLGWLYSNAEGMPQDYEKSLYWYQKAANQGDISALNNLGVIYQYGKGVPEDKRKAFQYFYKAAEGGNQRAQKNLASMYADGEGVTQDYKQAVYWLQKAAEQEEE